MVVETGRPPSDSRNALVDVPLHIRGDKHTTRTPQLSLLQLLAVSADCSIVVLTWRNASDDSISVNKSWQNKDDHAVLEGSILVR